MISRRWFLAASPTAIAFASGAFAQSRQLPLVVILAPERPPFPGYDAFLDGLRALGQIEGTTYRQKTRWSEGQRMDLYRQFANEAHAIGANIIVTGDTPGTIAAREVTWTTPIVMAFLGAGDPVQLGLAQSIGRPGGNVTGIYSQTDILAGKRLQIVRELLPTAQRTAVLHVSVEAARRAAIAHEQPAKTLGLEVRLIEVAAQDNFDAGFSAAKQWGADAVLLVQSAVFYRNMASLAEAGLKYRLPTLAGETGFAAHGGLINQGPNIADAWRRAAAFVDKILKGSTPADLPIEQPTVFKLAVNLKTAKALGLTVPPTLLARADEVFE